MASLLALTVWRSLTISRRLSVQREGVPISRIATGLAALAAAWMTLEGMGEARADPNTYSVSGKYGAFD
jgi:hypothetical protein